MTKADRNMRGHVLHKYELIFPKLKRAYYCTGGSPYNDYTTAHSLRACPHQLSSVVIVELDDDL